MSKEMTSAQRKELAKTLYLKADINQQDLADQVGVTRQTVNRWVSEWKHLRRSLSQTREERINSILKQLEDLDNTIAARPEGQRYPTSKEADIHRKLTADLNTLEQDASIRDVVNVSRSFLDWLRQRDPEKAKELSDYFDEYIKYQMQ